MSAMSTPTPHLNGPRALRRGHPRSRTPDPVPALPRLTFVTSFTPSGLLAAALSADPSRPLLTYLDESTGERTEASVTTFDNWVAKTANLLVDDLAAEPGARVALLLPLHWQSAVWLAACWATGCVAVPEGDASTADV